MPTELSELVVDKTPRLNKCTCDYCDNQKSCSCDEMICKKTWVAADEWDNKGEDKNEWSEFPRLRKRVACVMRERRMLTSSMRWNSFTVNKSVLVEA